MQPLKGAAAKIAGGKNTVNRCSDLMKPIEVSLRCMLEDSAIDAAQARHDSSLFYAACG
jgi:hypothetical protein